MLTPIIVIIVVVMLFIWVIYNSLIRAKIRVSEAFSQIDVQLKRRADLIPNLVETVKGYASHEKETLEGVVVARSKATSIQVGADIVNNPELLKKFQQSQLLFLA